MAVLGDNLELLKALLPEIMRDASLRQRYFDTVIEPTYRIAAHYFGVLQQRGAVKQIDSTLLLRVISSTLLGLPVLNLLGDDTVRQAWSELPNVISSVFLRGLLPEGRP